MDRITRESELEFVSRIQLTCSGAKQDVYFALESSKVFPEVFRTPPEWKALYERVRCK